MKFPLSDPKLTGQARLGQGAEKIKHDQIKES